MVELMLAILLVLCATGLLISAHRLHRAAARATLEREREAKQWRALLDEAWQRLEKENRERIARQELEQWQGKAAE